MKSNYILKRERLAPDLAKLQMFYDYHLSIESEMVKALMRAGMYGNHGGGGKSNGDSALAKRGNRQVDGSDCEGTGHETVQIGIKDVW
jgi:hypothetical protein